MPQDFMPGLAGVPAAKSSISDVDGQRGVLEYRGIRVEELCLKSSYLETAYLLLFGHLLRKRNSRDGRKTSSITAASSSKSSIY